MVNATLGTPFLINHHLGPTRSVTSGQVILCLIHGVQKQAVMPLQPHRIPGASETSRWKENWAWPEQFQVRICPRAAALSLWFLQTSLYVFQPGPLGLSISLMDKPSNLQNKKGCKYGIWAGTVLSTLWVLWWFLFHTQFLEFRCLLFGLPLFFS